MCTCCYATYLGLNSKSYYERLYDVSPHRNIAPDPAKPPVHAPVSRIAAALLSSHTEAAAYCELVGESDRLAMLLEDESLHGKRTPILYRAASQYSSRNSYRGDTHQSSQPVISCVS